MATHDYVIDNQSAPAFRSDLNNALLAIVSQNSASTAPTTTYANMLWYDTATNILKKRNEANSAWINLGTIDEAAGTFTPSGGGSIASQAEAEAGTNNTNLMTPLRTSQAIAVLGSHVNYQVFTESGTWTKPSNLSADAIVVVEMWGGGGGGGRQSSSSGGGGGGGGGFATETILASSLGSTVAVTVGAGGAGATVSGNAGAAGGSSSFGSDVVAYPGNGGSGLQTGARFGGSGGGHSFIGDFWAGKGAGRNSAGDLILATFPDLYCGGGAGHANSGGTRAVYGGGGGGTHLVSGEPSKYAGAGGNVGANGGVPAGGGGGGQSVAGGAGGRGEVRVWTIG
jgi:hypothetical protein